MSIKQEIEILPADEIKEPDIYNQIIITSSNKVIKNDSFKLGWPISESIGIGAINLKAINKLIIKRY